MNTHIVPQFAAPECKYCRFLGSALAGQRSVDLYFCDDPVAPSVVAKYGDDPDDIASGLSNAHMVAELGLARQWSIDMGYLNGPQQELDETVQGLRSDIAALRRSYETGRILGVVLPIITVIGIIALLARQPASEWRIIEARQTAPVEICITNSCTQATNPIWMGPNLDWHTNDLQTVKQ